MPDDIRISIIIPVHDNIEYLSQTLKSATDQTLKEIEIICLDDCSQDGSCEYLRKEAEKDERIRVFSYDCNVSASRCRRDGVLASKGEYVMFLDGDDYLETDACRIAYDAIREKDTDILHFGSFVDNYAGFEEKRIENIRKMLKPCPEEIRSADLLSMCFIEKRFGWTLWNKIYRGNMCREAMSAATQERLPKANDVYGMYLILDQAKSYASIDRQLYHYCFGRGMTGHSRYSLEMFETHCQSIKVIKALEDRIGHIEEENERKRQKEIVEKIEKGFANELASKWLRNTGDDIKKEAFSKLIDAWGADSYLIISSLAASKWFNEKEVAEQLSGSSALSFRKRKIRNIALYYGHIQNGGAQRVVALLCNRFSRLKEEDGSYMYNVLLITDRQPSENDYPLDARVRREVIPAQDVYNRSKYQTRAEAFYRLIEEYELDLIINSRWDALISFWDLLTIKSAPSHPACIFHVHNSFGIIYKFHGNLFSAMPEYYPIADAVVVLSEMDQKFWSLYHPRVYMIENPISLQLRPERVSTDRNRVLWIGRITKEKQPLEMVRIMKALTERMPKLHCDIVGGGKPDLYEELQQLIRTEGLEDVIELHGFQNDVDPYYESASVLCMTSEYEGLPLTLLEAASYSLPIVMYDLPWIECNRVFPDLIRVRQKDAIGAADALYSLLNDEERYKAISSSMHDCFRKYMEIDILEKWQNVFAAIENSAVNDETLEYDSRTAADMVSIINLFHGQLIADFKENEKEIEALKKQIGSKEKTYEKKLNQLKKSRSYRIGRMLTWLPRKLKN